MEREPPPRSRLSLKPASKFTLEQLIACFPAYEAFKEHKKQNPGSIRPYAVRIFEDEKFIYVEFSPDRERIAGAVYGGGFECMIDKVSNEVVSKMIHK
jgi:hypothetical protein